MDKVYTLEELAELTLETGKLYSFMYNSTSPQYALLKQYLYNSPRGTDSFLNMDNAEHASYFILMMAAAEGEI